MPRIPYMRAFPRDWLTGTRDLTIEESGLYWEMCCQCFIDEGLPPNAAEIGHKLARNPRSVRKVLRLNSDGIPAEFPVNSAGILKHWFFLSDGRIMNKRVFAELQRYNSRSQKEKESENTSSLYSKDGRGAAGERAPRGASPTRPRARGGTEHVAEVFSRDQIFDKKRRQALDRIERRKNSGTEASA